MDKAMRTRSFVILGIGAVLVGAIAIPPMLRRSGVLPHRWEALNDGPVTGIAWKRLVNSEDAPAGTGRIASWASHLSGPNDFVYRVKDATVKTEAFLVVDGHEIPVPSLSAFSDPQVRSAQPIREYPPSLDEIELLVKTPGKPDSRFRLQDLPPTQYRFPVGGPEKRTETVDGVRFEASAWTEEPLAHRLPYIAAAVRVVGARPPGENWEWRGPQLAIPFRSTAEPEQRNFISYSGLTFSEYQSLGLSLTHPWASRMEKVRLSGRLSQFEEVRDIVDFGEFEVYRHMSHSKVDYTVRLNKPIVAESAGGLRVRLDPVRRANMGHGEMFDPQIGVRLFVEASSAKAGFSEKMREAKGETVVLVGWASEDSTSPLQVPGEELITNPTTFLTSKGLKPGDRIRLKLRFVRKVALREIPFDLTPSVLKRPSPVASTATMRKTLDQTSSSFTPKAEDFLAARAHN